MPEKPLIRLYQPQDKEALLQLFRLNTPLYFAPEEEKDLILYLDNYSENHFVLEQEGEILGCGGFNFSDDRHTGKISWDIIHPAQQGKGLGSLLTQYRIDKLKSFPEITCISVRTSQVAFRFYEKLGFTLREVVKDYWAEGFDMYRMDFYVGKISAV